MSEKRFIDYLTHEKRFSVHTITAYRKDLDQCRQFLSESYEMGLEQATHSMLRTWIVSMMDEGLGPRSANRKISTLRAYYRFLMGEGVRSDNPMAKVVAPKVPSKLPVFVEESGMDKLFSEIEFGEDFAGRRDRLVLELFYQTGMRLSELIGLREADVRGDHLKVLGKRNKERIVPITGGLQRQISDYVALKHQEGLNQAPFLMVTNKGGKLYEKFVYRLVNHYLGKSTSLSKKSPHILRHTFATHMLNNGADLNAIKEILGHANLSATQVYTHNSIEKLKQVHEQAHPRGG